MRLGFGGVVGIRRQKKNTLKYFLHLLQKPEKHPKIQFSLIWIFNRTDPKKKKNFFSLCFIRHRKPTEKNKITIIQTNSIYQTVKIPSEEHINTADIQHLFFFSFFLFYFYFYLISIFILLNLYSLILFLFLFLWMGWSEPTMQNLKDPWNAMD